jgi:phospholipase C
MDIKHVVVLLLENRSFDSMLGTLYPKSDRFDGLDGSEENVWHKTDGTPPVAVAEPVWASPEMTPQAACISTPDPGERFSDIHMQINGLAPGASMSGFVDMTRRRRCTTSPATNCR